MNGKSGYATRLFLLLLAFVVAALYLAKDLRQSSSKSESPSSTLPQAPTTDQQKTDSRVARLELVSRRFGRTLSTHVDKDRQLAYVGTVNSFAVVDVKNASHPVVIGEWPLPYPEEIVAMAFPGAGDYVFVVSARSESDQAYKLGDTMHTVIRSMDVSNPRFPTVNGMLKVKDFYVNKIEIQDGKLFAGGGRLVIFDVSSPTDIRLLGEFKCGGECCIYDQFFISNNLIYAGGECEGYGVDVIDIADATSPVRIARMNVEYYQVSSIFVSGNYAYISAVFHTGPSRLFIYDITDVTTPVLSINYEIQGLPDEEAWGVWVKDGFGYVLTEKRVWVFDTANLPSLEFIRKVPKEKELPPPVPFRSPIPYFEDIAVRGDIAYAINPTGFFTLDISQPGNPQIVSHYKEAVELFYWKGLVLSGNRAFALRVDP